MKTFEEDKELKQLLKSIKLERPAPDFTKEVMNRVFQERTVTEQVTAEPILGKGFWILVSLFVLLMVAMIVFAGNGLAPESAGLLPEINAEKYVSGYRSFFDSLDNLPAGVAGIFLGLSFLVFLERFLSARKTELA